MGRPKKAITLKQEQSLKEILAYHGVDAVDEVLKIATEQIEIRPDDDPKWFMDLLSKGNYELVVIGGKKFIRPSVKIRTDIFLDLAQYSHAKLRSVETKGSVDYNFNVTIKQFDTEPKRIDVVDVTPKQISE